MSPQIVFEDEHLIVLNKPRELHSVTLQSKPEEFTVQAFLESREIELPEGGLLQRLDYFTDGLMLAAKTRDALEFLDEEQKLGRFRKGYRVIAEGLFPKNKDVLVNKIILIKNSKTVKVFDPLEQVRTGRKGRGVNVRLSVANVEHQGNQSMVELFGEKLVRHQVRAQMAYAGYPLVGDTLYGGSGEGGFSLSAFSLSFRHPETETGKDFTLDVQN